MKLVNSYFLDRSFVDLELTEKEYKEELAWLHSLRDSLAAGNDLSFQDLKDKIKVKKDIKLDFEGIIFTGCWCAAVRKDIINNRYYGQFYFTSYK